MYYKLKYSYYLIGITNITLNYYTNKVIKEQN